MQCHPAWFLAQATPCISRHAPAVHAPCAHRPQTCIRQAVHLPETVLSACGIIASVCTSPSNISAANAAGDFVWRDWIQSTESAGRNVRLHRTRNVTLIADTRRFMAGNHAGGRKQCAADQNHGRHPAQLSRHFLHPAIAKFRISRIYIIK